MEIKFFQGNDVQYRNPGFLMMCKFLKLYVIIGFLLRMVLIFREVVRCLGIGVFSDFGMGVLLTIPIAILYLGLNEWKYGRKTGLAIEALLIAAFLYSLWPQSLFHQYGGGAPPWIIWSTLMRSSATSWSPTPLCHCALCSCSFRWASFAGSQERSGSSWTGFTAPDCSPSTWASIWWPVPSVTG